MTNHNINPSQFLNIRVSETGVTTENENVAHVRKAFCCEFQSYDFIQFVLK